jgi:hypothetical protein
MSKEKVQHLMTKYSIMSNVVQWESRGLSVCRYNYKFELSEGNSFWIGFCPNWKKHEPYIDTGRVEFNPSKVGFDTDFELIYNDLLNGIPHGLIKPIKFDLAIDIPVARHKVHLIKDNRLYEEISRSLSDRTQYLGPRNEHGRVKLYSKALEQKLDIDLTRLEITMSYKDCSFQELQRLIPNMYILDSYQFSLGMSGTDSVLMVAILNDFDLLQKLGRTKREKIKAYLADMQLSLKVDIQKYNQILDQIRLYLK